MAVIDGRIIICARFLAHFFIFMKLSEKLTKKYLLIDYYML